MLKKKTYMEAIYFNLFQNLVEKVQKRKVQVNRLS